MSELTASQRREIAKLVGVNDQYLYQCLTGRREMNPVEARRIERESDGRVRRWQICQRTWHLIWPELIGTDGAPTPADDPAYHPPPAAAATPPVHHDTGERRRITDLQPHAAAGGC